MLTKLARCAWFVCFAFALSCAKAPSTEPGGFTVYSETVQSAKKYAPSGVTDGVIYATRLEYLPNALTEITHVLTLVFDRPFESLSESVNQGLGINVLSVESLRTIGLDLQSDALLVAHDEGISATFRVRDVDALRHYLAALRQRVIANNEDAQAIDRLEYHETELHFVAGEHVDVTWALNGPWLHLRVGGRQPPMAWMKSIASKQGPNPQTTAWLNEAEESSLKMATPASVFGAMQSRVMLGGNACQDSLSRSVPVFVFSLSFTEGQIQAALSASLVRGMAQNMSQAMHRGEPMNFELKKRANAWGSYRLSPRWLGEHFSACFIEDVVRAPHVANLAIEQVDPKRMTGKLALSAHLADKRPVVALLDRIPMRGLFESNITLGGFRVQQLKLPSLPKVFYRLDGPRFWMATDAPSMLEAMTPDQGQDSSFAELGIKPHGLNNLEGLLGEAYRQLGFKEEGLAQRQANRLRRYRMIRAEMGLSADKLLLTIHGIL